MSREDQYPPPESPPDEYPPPEDDESLLEQPPPYDEDDAESLEYEPPEEPPPVYGSAGGSQARSEVGPLGDVASGRYARGCPKEYMGSVVVVCRDRPELPVAVLVGAAAAFFFLRPNMSAPLNRGLNRRPRARSPTHTPQDSNLQPPALETGALPIELGARESARCNRADSILRFDHCA